MFAVDCWSLIMTIPEICSNTKSTAGVIFQRSSISPATPGPLFRLSNKNINTIISDCIPLKYTLFMKVFSIEDDWVTVWTWNPTASKFGFKQAWSTYIFEAIPDNCCAIVFSLWFSNKYAFREFCYFYTSKGPPICLNNHWHLSWKIDRNNQCKVMQRQ